MLLAALSLASALLGTAFTFDPERNLEELGFSHFAPVSSAMWRGRFPGDGSLRYFRLVGSDGKTLRISSADGWTGTVSGAKAFIVPSAADRAGKTVAEYRFEDGNLVGLIQGGELSEFSNSDKFPCSGQLPAPWKAKEDFSPEQLVTDIWAGSGRLRFGYKNPNCCGALLAEFAVLAFILLLLKHPVWKVLGCLLLVPALVLMGKTQSRGAFLSFVLAATVVLVPYGRAFLRKLSVKRVIGFALVGLAVVGALYFGGYCERFAQTARNRGSDLGRTEALGKVPEMIACAPGGWNEPVAGMAYVMWFQDQGRSYLVKDMMNEHLTFLVMHAWPVRFAYLFGWLAVLLFLVGSIRKGGSPVPLGLWIVQGVTSALNRTFISPTLWILPVAGLLWALCRADWRRDWRHYARYIGAAAILAGAVLIVVQVIGLRLAARQVPQIRSDGRRVTINGTDPVHWVVDEPTVLNPTYAGKDIRRYFSGNPGAPALGFVRSVEDLPRDARHVTMFGRSCERYVERFKSDPGMVLPRKLTFISPTVAPSEIPGEMRKRCVFRMHLGSIQARYFMDDGPFPIWVLVWPGMEIYLPDWVEIALDRSEGD